MFFVFKSGFPGLLVSAEPRKMRAVAQKLRRVWLHILFCALAGGLWVRPFFAWPRNFTVAVRKGLKDTTSTHRTSGSIFPRPPRALFQPCSRGLGRAQRGGMPAPSRAHKARGRLAFLTGPDADTSGRARALGPWCPLPLACSHLQRHQPPALPTRLQIFDFDSLSGSINGSHPLV